jgi:hypothetical protein
VILGPLFLADLVVVVLDITLRLILVQLGQLVKVTQVGTVLEDQVTLVVLVEVEEEQVLQVLTVFLVKQVMGGLEQLLLSQVLL